MTTPEDGLTVEVRREGTSATAVAAGELDMTTMGELRAAATEARAGADKLVLDLRRLTFIDSSGLGALVELRGEAERGGVGFVVEASDGPVRSALESTGLNDLLGVR